MTFRYILHFWNIYYFLRQLSILARLSYMDKVSLNEAPVTCLGISFFYWKLFSVFLLSRKLFNFQVKRVQSGYSAELTVFFFFVFFFFKHIIFLHIFQPNFSPKCLKLLGCATFSPKRMICRQKQCMYYNKSMQSGR